MSQVEIVVSLYGTNPISDEEIEYLMDLYSHTAGRGLEPSSYFGGRVPGTEVVLGLASVQSGPTEEVFKNTRIIAWKNSRDELVTFAWPTIDREEGHTDMLERDVAFELDSEHLRFSISMESQ